MPSFWVFHTWEISLLVIVILFFWGLLRERSRRKQLREKRGDTIQLSRDLMIRASRAGYNTIQGITGAGTRQTPMGSPAESALDILPISGDPANPDDRFVSAALGMETNRQDFYRQAWEASHNNEYTSAKPGSW